jgi:hypothetical protein
MELSSASLYSRLEGGPDSVLQHAALSVLEDAMTQDGELLMQLLQQPDPAQLARQQLADGRRLDVRV